MDQKTINNNYVYHKPEGDDQAKYTAIRAKAKELAELINQVCPASRELSVAHTHLETAVMWANASIARDGKAPEEPFHGRGNQFQYTGKDDRPYPQAEETTPAYRYPKSKDVD